LTLFFYFIVSGKRTACAVIRSDVKRFYDWNLKQCKIECCTDNNCNNHIPTFISEGNEKTIVAVDENFCFLLMRKDKLVLLATITRNIHISSKLKKDRTV